MDTMNDQHLKMPEGYNFSEIEANWQRVWDEEQTFSASDSDQRPKLYVLQMFPYPSGDLHAGHIRNYVLGDAVARYWKMMGFNVMHPMGFDSFGLPAEQAAIDHKIHPAQWIERCVENSRQQFKRYGFSFDWARELVTSDPKYYKWTQWLFLKFYEMGLIYRKEIEVNWCPEHGVLANDEVKDGQCWRCDSEVGKQKMAQWIMRTTRYAKRLLDGIDTLPGWSNAVRSMQRNWIGESYGTNIVFKVHKIEGQTPQGEKPELTVFTTRVDTVFGCTFMAIAPDHPLAQTIAKVGGTDAELKQFAAECTLEENKYGLSDDKPKRGIYLGVDCINPFDNEPVQIWTTNYVVSDFGTGAVMAVPAHDTRDNAFAKEYGLPITEVIEPGKENGGQGRPPAHNNSALTEKGTCINSGEFDGMDFEAAKAAMDKWLEEHELGGNTVEYKLRDWNMGRQRFWGAPIPMVECAKCGWQPVATDKLPVELPDHADYSDVRVSPLANDAAWKSTTCPECGGDAQRDTDTMTTFMCSAWYFLRFCDPHNESAIFDPAKVARWMPVDYYVGGKEHAVGHLLYSRFIMHALVDAGMLALSKADHQQKLPSLSNEPFLRLFNQGIVYKDGKKMSKSKGNVVSSDQLAERYGADTARLFALFGGPADQDLEWSSSSVEGCHRFLKRIWRFASTIVASSPENTDSLTPAAEEAVRLRHQAVAGVTDDLGKWHFNTAISKLMEYLNGLSAAWKTANDVDSGLGFNNALLTMAQLLSPFAPHFAEELWLQLGGTGLVCESEWPQFDPEMLVEDTIEIPVQVNGKVRGKIIVPANSTPQETLAVAKADESVAKWLEGKQVVKEIVIPSRMVTLVVK